MRSGAAVPIAIRRATPGDVALLAELGATTFTETFAADNRPDDMASYLAGAFSEERQRAELLDPRVTIMLAERGGEVVGYVMLRESTPPAALEGLDAIEIARLYARRSALGSGVGASLMTAALGEAAARGKDAIWLGVWERNLRAIAFYAKWEFSQTGSQPFMLGRDLQNDLIMMRRMAREP